MGCGWLMDLWAVVFFCKHVQDTTREPGRRPWVRKWINEWMNECGSVRGADRRIHDPTLSSETQQTPEGCWFSRCSRARHQSSTDPAEAQSCGRPQTSLKMKDLLNLRTLNLTQRKLAVHSGSSWLRNVQTLCCLKVEEHYLLPPDRLVIAFDLLTFFWLSLWLGWSGAERPAGREEAAVFLNHRSIKAADPHNFFKVWALLQKTTKKKEI